VKYLTDRQKQILAYIEQTIEARGYPPSVRDICKAFNIQSPQGAQRHILALEKKGYLKRDPRIARSLTVVDPDEKLVSPGKTKWVPVIGEVAAGAPILAQEDVLDQIPLSKDWLNLSKDYFFLRIKGRSMAEAIQPGDSVLVERCASAAKGEIVVALIEDEATCKRFFPEKNRVILKSDNPEYDDIVVSKDLQLIGKVKALIRKYP
jgi:repressor LexA